MKIIKLPVEYIRFLNKVLITNDAKYGYLQEIEKDGRRYIIASRHRFEATP
jgi:hypothetical protein